MKNPKIRNIAGIVINSLTIIFVIISIIMIQAAGPGQNGELGSYGWGMLKYFTNLSNYYGGIAAIIMIIFEAISLKRGKEATPLWVLLIKFTAVVSLMITFLVTALFLGPTNALNGGSYFSLFSGSALFLHLLVPLSVLASFSLFELHPSIKFRLTPIGMAPMVLYAIFYILNYYCHWVRGNGIKGGSEYDWYGFFGDGSPLRAIIVCLIVFAFAYLVSLLVYFLNHLAHKKLAIE